MKVIDMDLSFHMPPKSINFDICNLNYGQISGRRSKFKLNHHLNFSTKFKTLKGKTGLWLQHESCKAFSKLFIHIKNDPIRHVEL